MYPVGVAIQDLGNNEYKINNTKSRLAAFKLICNNVACGSTEFLEPITFLNYLDIVGLMTNWNQTVGQIILKVPSTQFKATNNSQVEVVGSVSRIAFIPFVGLSLLPFKINDITSAMNADPNLFVEVNMIDTMESMSVYLCKRLSSLFQIQRESVCKNNRKLIQRILPLPDRHCPFLFSIL